MRFKIVQFAGICKIITHPDQKSIEFTRTTIVTELQPGRTASPKNGYSSNS